ncbi:MAG TPA: ABC transporter permease [Candidatus Udaeobacter sp.]|jgi:putative ABC transport system permease protein
MFGGLWQDIRYGARMLLKSPTYTAIAVAALALSIGANTAVFTAANALLLRPLPVENIDRLIVPVTLREGFDPFGSPFLEYAAYRDRAHCLASSGIARALSFNLTGRGEAQRIRGASVTAGYLSTLGTKPVLGRTFLDAEDRPGGPRVALISYALWQKHFGGNADVVTQSLVLDGRSYNIVGVMPPGFDLPGMADVWIPLQTNIDSLPLTERAATTNTIIARLRPGVSLGQADAELKAIARQLEQEYPAFRRGWTVKAVSLRQDLLGDLEGRVHRALFALMAAVAFLLLICCANVANLQLARGVARERELVLRRALGAAPWRIVRQLLAENILLSVIGGIAGLLLGQWLLPILASLNPIQGISLAAFFHDFSIDRRVLIFVLCVTVFTGVAFGLLPALKGAGAHELMPRIRQGDQHTGRVAGRGWLKGLIVAEIAIALTVLICGGLMVQSFQRLQHVALGFTPDNLLTTKMVLPASKYPEYRQRVAFADNVLERALSLPGVVSAGLTTNIPLERETAYDAIFDVEGRPPHNPNDVPITSHRIVSPGYMETLGITLMRGRLVNQNDRADTSPVVVVSEEFARQAWPGSDAIGKRVRRIRAGQDFPWMTVVGVVKNVKEDLFNYRINRPVWYVPYAQVENDFPLNLVLRTRVDPTSLSAAVRDVVRAIDPDQPVSNVMTMNAILSKVLVTERFGAVLMGTLAISGLVLASIGLYGVMAYSVKQRTGEIGLRVALGAQRKHVFALFMGEGVRLTFFGLTIGLAMAWAATGLLTSLLFETPASDPATFVAISLLLVSIALLACFLPARRALSVDPIIALRAE